MLVLSRKANEDVLIGEGKNQIVIKICEIRGDKVRIGIDADKVIPILRREVYEALQRNIASESDLNSETV
ncbi:MAG: carbon storage regulator [Pirellulaceae bacterium]